MRTGKISLPRTWPDTVRSAILHVISLAQYATAYTRSWAADSRNARMRLQVKNDRLQQEISLLNEELRIKDARMSRIDPRRRPHYPPTERMAILQLRAARNWSLARVAAVFQLTSATISHWMKRLDDSGPHALVEVSEPINRFPDLVRYLVRQLKILCPSMGKVKLAQVLARAGLHLAPTTISRILKEQPFPKPKAPAKGTDRVVTARHPNHVWHVDLTAVPISGGYWAPWNPLALLQRGPFCWWVAVAIDHDSRRVMGFAVFKKTPTSVEVRAFLGRTMTRAKAGPQHLICDKGGQFWCDGFKTWCRRRNIKPRFGAVGQHVSIAVVERFIRTMKQEGLRRILIPLNRDQFRQQINAFIDWYNEHRPHMTLDGCTPNERYHGRRPANRQPRCEPRPGWPRPSPCAAPQTLVKGQPGVRLRLHVEFAGDQRHLPIVTLNRAA
jgi:transposase InsO family protein